MLNFGLEKKYTERDTNRVGLIFYDFLFFSVSFIHVFIVHISGWDLSSEWAFSDHMIQFVLAFGCLLGARLILKCYKQVLRYGNMGAFARMMLAELLGGFVYILLEMLLPVRHVPGSSMLLLIGLDYGLVISARIIYYYLYQLAMEDTKVAKLLRGFLITFGAVDVESREIGATYTLKKIFGMDMDSRARNVAVNEIINVARKFDIPGDVVSAKEINKGYINRTYRVDTQTESGDIHKYILQRINTNVFKDPDLLMDNYRKVTEHLGENFKLARFYEFGSTPRLMPVRKTGESYIRVDSGCYRMMNYFDDVESFDIPDSPDTFAKAGYSFGLFLKCMSDMPVSELKDTIPNFHNTKSRYKDLLAAIGEDPVRRVKSVVNEIRFVMDRSARYGMIADALESGRIPYRITHNDCNLNNILFDSTTHDPVAVIDLDTVMAGSPIYDYGDSMRIGTNTAKDDEKDLSKVSCDLRLYEAYARGYLKACGSILTENELKLLPYASLIITSEDGIRFLMDYINGDTYYTIYYPEQNLDRCRTQLKLVEDMERKLPQIRNILKKIYAELGIKVTLEDNLEDLNYGL